MALADLPAWTIKPDWSGGVLERLEWLTTVLTSRTGTEQRIGFRLSPRRSFDLSFILSGRERALFDLSVGRVGPGEWWVPLWHAGSTLGAALAAGQTYCPTATAGREWKAPGAALLLGGSAFSYEIAEIVAVGAGGITFAAGVSQSWGPQTKLYPLRRGRLSEQPKVARKTESVGLAQARILLTEPDDYTPIAWPVTYRGTPVLTVRPDETQSLSVEYERLVAELDSTTGAAHVMDLAPDRGLTVQQHAWFLHGIAEHSDFRALLYALQGRLVPVWMPTHSADLELAASAVPGASAIVVKECGYTAFNSIRPGRRDIRIERYDGTAEHRRIISSARTGGTKESLVLDTPLLSGVSPLDVRRISFMALGRLDQDAVEIAHKTDVAGLSTVVAAFRSTAETRAATSWTPQLVENAAQTPWPCGTPADCTALGAWAAAYMIPTFTQFTEPYNTIGSLGVPCDGGHRVCWYAGYRLAVTRDGWTPELRAALAAVVPYDPMNGNFFSYRPFLSGRLRNAMLVAADAGESTSAAMCGARILAVGEAHSAWARQDLGADNLARHFTVIAYSTTRRAAWFDTGFDVRDPTSGAITKHEQGTFSEYPVAGGGWLYLAEFWGDLESVFYNIYNPSSPYRTHLDWYADKWSIPESPFIASIPL